MENYKINTIYKQRGMNVKPIQSICYHSNQKQNFLINWSCSLSFPFGANRTKKGKKFEKLIKGMKQSSCTESFSSLVWGQFHQY